MVKGVHDPDNCLLPHGPRSAALAELLDGIGFCSGHVAGVIRAE